MTTQFALIIPTFENNIGYKLAALDTYIKELPENVDVFFIYGGSNDTSISCDKNGVHFTDVYLPVPDQIINNHKKLFLFFKKYKKVLKKYDYILKLDDDTFLLNSDILSNIKLTGDYIGNKVEINEENETLIRYKAVNAKTYKIREPYNHDLPRYFCSGECFILSKKSLQEIMSYRGKLKKVKSGLDDLIIAKILEEAEIKININKQLFYEHPCNEQQFYKLYTQNYEDSNISTM